MRPAPDPEMTKGSDVRPSPSVAASFIFAHEPSDVQDDNTTCTWRNNALARARRRMQAARGWQMRPRAREVFSVILDYCEAAGDVECSPSVDEIADAARMSHRSVQRALRDLERRTFIATKLRRIGPKLNDTNVYRILPAGGELLDLPRSLRAPPSPRPKRSSTMPTRAPIHDQSEAGAAASVPDPPSAGPAAPAGEEAARTGLSSFARAVLDKMRREDAEAERVLDMIGPAIPAPVVADVVGPGEAGAELDEDIPREERPGDDGWTTSPGSEETPRAEHEWEGGTPEGGAVAPSQIKKDPVVIARARRRARSSRSPAQRWWRRCSHTGSESSQRAGSRCGCSRSPGGSA